MAKRKGARAKGRKTAGKRAATSRPRARKPAALKSPSKRARATARKATARKATRKTPARKPTRKATARKAPARKAAARKATARKGTARTPSAPKPAARTAAPRKTPKNVSARKVPALDRARRTVQDEDIVPSPPSSLNMDRTASAARSGRRELLQKFRDHTETSPAITGGDIDADWESAYSVGDEAPGGDNPTPDMDIVDDIGRALGVEYQDSEELRAGDKVADRDKHRWELDPASSEDYRNRKK